MAPTRLRQQWTERLGAPLDLGVGRVYIERRNDSPVLSARTFIQGKYKTWSTNERDERPARRAATEQFLELFKKSQAESLHARLFSDVAQAFLDHADTALKGEISDGQIEQYHIKWSLLKKHFTGIKITDIDAAFLVKLRNVRATESTQRKTLVKPATLKKDFVFVRLVLKYARDVEKSLEQLPQFPKLPGSQVRHHQYPQSVSHGSGIRGVGGSGASLHERTGCESPNTSSADGTVCLHHVVRSCSTPRRRSPKPSLDGLSGGHLERERQEGRSGAFAGAGETRESTGE